MKIRKNEAVYFVQNNRQIHRFSGFGCGVSTSDRRDGIRDLFLYDWSSFVAMQTNPGGVSANLMRIAAETDPFRMKREARSWGRPSEQRDCTEFKLD